MEKMEKFSENNNENSSVLLDTLYDYLKYWKWFIVSIICSLAIGVAVVFVSQKQYKSSLSILLNEDKGSNKTSGPEFDLGTLGLLSTTNNIENEIAILSSTDLIRSVVDSLNLRVTYYIVDNLKKVELYGNSPWFVTVETIGEKDINENIAFYLKKAGKGYEMEGTYGDEEIHEKITALPAKVKIGNNAVVHIKTTEEQILDDEKYHITINRLSATVAGLFRNLTVSPTSKTSSVLNLSLVNNNTQKGSALLRELVKQYNEMNIKINNEIAYSTSLFINDRLKEIAIELGDAEGSVVDFKQKNKITDLTAEAQLIVNQTGQNEQKLLEIETQLNVIALIERFVNDPNNKYKIIPNIGISDVGLAQIIGEYNNKLLNSEVQLKGMGEQNPSYIRLTEDIENMRSNIVHSLNNVKQSYLVVKKDLVRQSTTTKARISSVPKQEQGLIEKVREQRIKETLFLFLMQKREETNLSIASTSNKARIIISPEEDLLPIAPKAQIIVLSALILGVLIPIVIIYVLSLFKTQIKDRQELEKLSQISILGEIGNNESKANIVVESNQTSKIAEMFRTLRNSLNFAINYQNHLIIQITSTTKGEGKTFISANFAMSLAISGKKILLVGGDIRNPQLNKYFDVKQKKGLSDYLGSDDTWQKYTHKSNLSQNLQIMMAGTLPPNPNELLMSERLETFLTEAKKEYDYVLIDSAPVGLVSDSYIINKYCDMTLYVTRENYTPKTAVNFMNIQQQEKKLNNMYLVLNDAQLDNSYKYGYGKDYGYETK